MLFFSTTGSFFGSVISTIVLMAFIGVHNTVIITLALITFLIFFISPRLLMPANVKAIALLALAWLFNNNDAMHQFHIVADTPYSTITMHKMDGTSDVILSINNSMSSKYSANPDRRFAYIHYIETHYINTMNAAAPKNILILGAGGFTVGFEDTRNHYTFVDIDPELKTVAEMHLLPHPLPPNKEFISTSARSFLHRATQKYDLIMIDLYSNRLSIPMEAITKEFLIEARRVLAPEGILIGNIISSPTLQDKFSVRYYRTFASVFPVFDRQIIGNFDGWSQANNPVNTLYIYYNNRFLQDETIYTDDKNTYSFDQ
jgi:predicted membrane-bound spermidine synthase